MTPEEIKAAKKIILAGILLKDGSQFDTTNNFVFRDTDHRNEWVVKVHDASMSELIYVPNYDLHPAQWKVTEKGLKFLAED
jgi:hypothetical protein